MKLIINYKFLIILIILMEMKLVFKIKVLNLGSVYMEVGGPRWVG